MQDSESRYAIVNGVRIYYRIAGRGNPLLLIHGFPQTSHAWANIIPALAEHYTVIAPDYRGAGESDKPSSDYDKVTVMEDLRAVVHQLGFKEIRVCGHDMGVMVAFPYAARHPDEVTHLALLDAPVPGTEAMEFVRSAPRAWHNNFHKVRDLPEALVAGREREYLTHFFKSRFTVPWAISQEDIDLYIRAYSAPGSMRAGFEMYRAFDKDAEDNRPYIAEKLKMPVLVLAGEFSVSAPVLKNMASEIAVNSSFLIVPGSGHWLCEQRPAEVQENLLAFFQS